MGLPDRNGVTMRTTLSSEGQLTVPEAVRAELGLQVGDDFEVAITDDGTVLLRPVKTIPPSQAWFWTSEWQRGEYEATQDIARGNVRTFKSGEAFLASLH